MSCLADCVCGPHVFPGMARYRGADLLRQVVALRHRGHRQVDIARSLGLTQGAVSKILKRNRETGTPVQRPRSGRPRISTARQDRWLVMQCRRNRWQTSTHLRQQWRGVLRRPVSTRTVRRRLCRAGYWARRPWRCPGLTLNHRRERRRWARAHRNWALGHWRHAVFADESRFTLMGNDGRQRVRRRVGERLIPACVAPTFGGRRPSVMAWGAIHHGGKSQLVIVDGTLRMDGYVDILRNQMLPFARATFRDNFIFVHDNATPHTGRVTRNFLEQEDVNVMDWPAKSPDMNPIEHVWDRMGVIIRDMDNPPTNLAQLRDAVVQAWAQIPMDDISHLVASMPNRVAALEAAHGGNTTY